MDNRQSTVRGVISVRLVYIDAYKQGRKNILVTQKPLKKVSVLEKLWNPGTQQLRTMLTIMRNNYQDNIQFYFEPHGSIFTRTQAFQLFLL